VAFLAAMAQVTGKDIYAYPIESYLALGSRAVFARPDPAASKEGREVKSAFRDLKWWTWSLKSAT